MIMRNLVWGLKKKKGWLKKKKGLGMRLGDSKTMGLSLDNEKEVNLMSGGNRRMKGFEGNMASTLLDILKRKWNRTTM